MRSHDDLAPSVSGVQERAASRRGVLRGAALGGLAVAGASRLAPSAAAQGATTDDLLTVLNYALTLEHLENAFYRDGLANFTADAFVAAGFQAGVRDYIATIGGHEAAHVETLTTVVTRLGGTPVQEGQYNFGNAFADLTAFLKTAATLENTGVSAYTGAAQYLISNDELLTAALTIHGVEARHAAYLNVLDGADPFPEALDPPLTPAQVVEAAGPFITAGEVVTPAAFAGGTPAAGGAAATPTG